MRLSRKLITVLLLVGLIPVGIGAAILKNRLTDFQHKYAAPQFQNTVLALSAGADKSFSGVNRTVGAFAAGLALARDDSRPALLRSYAAANPTYLSLRFVD